MKKFKSWIKKIAKTNKTFDLKNEKMRMQGLSRHRLIWLTLNIDIWVQLLLIFRKDLNAKKSCK